VLFRRGRVRNEEREMSGRLVTRPLQAGGEEEPRLLLAELIVVH
jgi:hypothetical protein